MVLTKTIAVNLTADDAKAVFLANCEWRDYGPYASSHTALLTDRKDSMTLPVYWRYRRPEPEDSFPGRQPLPSECYIPDEHGLVTFKAAGDNAALIECWKVKEVDRTKMRNLMGFLVLPAIVIGINWDFFSTLLPLRLRSLPQLIVWIIVLALLECFVWMTGLVPAEQREIDAYACIQNSLDEIFAPYQQG